MTILSDYWRSLLAYRVRIALRLLNEPYESRVVDLLKGEQAGPANRQRNPLGLVPTLEIDGQTLTQSMAIIEYLYETRGAGFLPDDSAGRARVRALAMAVACDIQPVCILRVARHAVEALGRGDHDGRVDEAFHRTRIDVARAHVGRPRHRTLLPRGHCLAGRHLPRAASLQCAKVVGEPGPDASHRRDLPGARAAPRICGSTSRCGRGESNLNGGAMTLAFLDRMP